MTSGMTAMSRRSREHRSSKNAGTIRDALVSQLDIASTSKSAKVGILSPSDASEHGKESGESPNLRRSSGRASAVYVSRGVEGRANGAKVHVQGAKNISAAASGTSWYAVAGGASEAVRGGASAEAGVGAGGQAAVAESNGTSAVTGADAAGQANGRPLRGRPRGRHATAGKKIARRAKRLQEVALTEGDGARILGRRIKVFWRDEDRWFYGVVKAYNRGRRTHKIVYDDKEEEWVKLHEEKFKLQVLEGEVFGAQQDAGAAGMEWKIGKRGAVAKQEHLSGEIGGGVATGNVRGPASPVRESENGVGSAGLWWDGQQREGGPGMRKGGANARGVGESDNASAMVCEGADVEDPYAIDHTSISDSLVMFMRSKQSLAESRRAAAWSGEGAAARWEAGGAGARSIIEVSLSVEPGLCDGGKGNVGVWDVAVVGSEAGDAVPESASSEGSRMEGRGSMSCEDGKGGANPEAGESAGGEDVDGSDGCGRQNVAEGLGSSAVGALHISGDGEVGVGEGMDVSDGGTSGVEVVGRVSSEEGGVGRQSREDGAVNPGDGCGGESGDGAAECRVGREVGPRSGEMSKSVARRVVGGGSDGGGQVESVWLVRPGRFISWSIGANLVDIDCTIPGQQVAVWIVGVDNVWRCVPYLTLFVDVILEGDRSKGESCVACTRRCYGEQSAKGISLRRSVLSALFSRSRGSPGLACPSSRLGSARVVLHGTRASWDGSKWEVKLRQGDGSEGVEVVVEANPARGESLCGDGDGTVAEAIEAKRPTAVTAVPVVDAVDSGGDAIEEEGDVVVGNVSPVRNVEADGSKSVGAGCSPDSVEVSVHSAVTG